MQITTRLLLPFTEAIDALALSYAVQLAEQYGATLVPLALIPVKVGKGPRLEYIQQAQDFLVLIQRKAKRQGVPIQTSQIYTHDVVRSIEAFAGEMNCEAVLLFISNTSEVLLGRTVVRTLVDRSICNMHMILLPEKRRRNSSNNPVHVPLLKRGSEENSDVSSKSAY